MCGLTGIITSNLDIDLNLYYSAHTKLAHRGPDDEGLLVLDHKGEMTPCKGRNTISSFCNLPDVRSLSNVRMVLGHHRLSILDRSHLGHQPMSFEGCWVILNGEIYNYLELREELETKGYSFITGTDTEVVLKAWHCWKERAFNRFNGMWALSIYEERSGRLILSRDRFGIKPLYYALLNDRFLFASEIKYFQSLMHLSPNEQRMAEYIAWCRLDHAETTMLEPIQQLMPGYWAEFDINTMVFSKHRYWHLSRTIEKFDDDEAIAQFQQLFDSAIDLRMRSDVPVGSLLSGGLDSTAIVCNLHHRHKFPEEGFHSYSAIFDEPEYIEEPLICQTVLRCQGLKPHYIKPAPDHFLKDFQKLIKVQEFPFRSLAVYSQYCIYREIKNNGQVVVLLNGQGADEIFGGYTAHHYALIASCLQQIRVLSAWREAKAFSKYRNILMLQLWKTVARSFASAWKTKLFPQKEGRHQLFSEVVLEKTRTYDKNIFENALKSNLLHSALPEYLRYEDRNSMAHSLEVRLPFLDYRLVEWAFSLGQNMKIRDGITKWVEREAIRKYATPAVCASRDKIGFVSPQEKWQQNELKNWLRINLRDADIPMLNTERLYKQYLQNPLSNGGWPFWWRVVCLSEWLKNV